MKLLNQRMDAAVCIVHMAQWIAQVFRRAETIVAKNEKSSNKL